MILFYDINSGEVFAAIEGRVHDEDQLNCLVDPGIGKENIGRYIIGWVKDGEQRIEHNLDKFRLLQAFEGLGPETPTDYKIDINTGELIKFDKAA